MSILTVSALRKVYSTRFGSSQVEALKNVNFSVEEGEFVAIMGESGSGKTTLLNIIAALDKPTSGSVLLAGRELSEIKDAELSNFRRDNLGFVFQEFNLLDTFTVEDNIYLPLVLAGKRYGEMAERLSPIAKRLSINDILKKYPYEISGGQKQRAAVAEIKIHSLTRVDIRKSEGTLFLGYIEMIGGNAAVKRNDRKPVGVKREGAVIGAFAIVSGVGHIVVGIKGNRPCAQKVLGRGRIAAAFRLPALCC